MKTYGCVEMKLDKEPFEKIKSGEKTIELRLYDEKRRKIRVGDIIVFTCRDGGERLARRVKALHLRISGSFILPRIFSNAATRPQTSAPQNPAIWKNTIRRRSRRNTG